MSCVTKSLKVLALSFAATLSFATSHADVRDKVVHGRFEDLMQQLQTALPQGEQQGDVQKLLQELKNEHYKVFGEQKDLVQTAPGFTEQAEAKTFLAPSPVESRQLWDPDEWGSGASTPTVIKPGLNLDNAVDKPYWMVDFPPEGSAQTGWNLCRNANQPSGGCCQQIERPCCTAKARNDASFSWQMCFDPDTTMIKVILPGNDALLADGEERPETYHLLMASVDDDDRKYHGRWLGPSEDCFEQEDLIAYSLVR